MRISQYGIDNIKRREACRLKAYLDQAGIPTIGYGITQYPNGNKVKLGDTITQAMADMYLLDEIKIYEDAVNSITHGLSQAEFDSNVSLCYNIGVEAYKKSTLAKRLKQCGI